MEIKKLEHSGLALTKNHETILIDPVEFKTKTPLYDKIVAVVITHKHNDHCQPELLAEILANSPNAAIFTAPDTSPLISGSIVVRNGETREVSKFKLQFFGQSHASIMADQIPCDNLGVVIDDVFANPGDSFDQPPIERPKILCVPVSAPWAKISDAEKFIEDVRPEAILPVHDAVLSELGKTFNNSWLKYICDSLGIKFLPLAPGEITEL